MGSSSIRWVDMSKGEIEGWKEKGRKANDKGESVGRRAEHSQPAVLLFCLVGL